MPVYDYKCQECDVTRTITISIKHEDFVMKCDCGREMVKVFGVGAVSFRGSGFYTNDK